MNTYIPPDITKDVRGMQVLAGALMLGLMVFAGIAVFVIGPKPGESLVAAVMAGMVLIELPLFFILPQTALKREPGDKFDVQKELGRYSGAMLMRYALCEGAAFVNIVAYIVAGQWWSLAVAGLMWLVMVAMFPTQTKVEDWLENRQEQAGMDYNRSDLIEDRR